MPPNVDPSKLPNGVIKDTWKVVKKIRKIQKNKIFFNAKLHIYAYFLNKNFLNVSLMVLGSIFSFIKS